jgi:hypothetical protein
VVDQFLTPHSSQRPPDTRPARCVRPVVMTAQDEGRFGRIDHPRR